MDSTGLLAASQGLQHAMSDPFMEAKAADGGDAALETLLRPATESPVEDGDAVAIDLGTSHDQSQPAADHQHQTTAYMTHWETEAQDGLAANGQFGNSRPANSSSAEAAYAQPFAFDASPSTTVPQTGDKGGSQAFAPNPATDREALPAARGAEHVRPGAAALVAAQEQGKKKSHARKQPKGHIPRPRNAFILFRKHITDNNLIPSTVEVKHQNVSVIASKMWAEAPPEVKAEFVEAARIEKEEHARKYPNYRYQPAYRRTDIIRRRVRKDPDEEEKCEAVASLLMEGKVGKKLEVEIRQVIAKPGDDAAATVCKKGRRRKDTPGELSKGALRAQRAQARAKALRENWLETTVLAANQHQQAVLHAEQERMYQQMQQQQMVDGYGPGPMYMGSEAVYDPYGANGGYHEDPYNPGYPVGQRFPGPMDGPPRHDLYHEAYGPADPGEQIQMGMQDPAYMPHTPLERQGFEGLQHDPYFAPGHARNASHQSRAPMQDPRYPQEGMHPVDLYAAAGLRPGTGWQDPAPYGHFGAGDHAMHTPHGTHHLENAQMMDTRFQHAPGTSQHFQHEFRPIGGPADLIAGAWQQEQQPFEPPAHAAPPDAPAADDFLPLLEPDDHAPAQEIDFGDKGELFGGMLCQQEAGEGVGGLDDYQQALRQQEEMELGLQRF